jgi:hypothetical protein
MGEAENPERLTRRATMDDLRVLRGAASPHFALQIRNRIVKLVMDLPPDDPVRREGERMVADLTRLGYTGQVEGHKHEDGIEPLASLGADADRYEDAYMDAPTTRGGGNQSRLGLEEPPGRP